VIFSDILCALEPLGVDYRIESGVGPVIDDPVTVPGDVPSEPDDVREALSYVGDLLARLDDEVGDEVPLIGFAGGPFTLASYLVAGGSSRTHLPVRRFRQEHPEAFRSLLSVLADVVRDHLAFQIDAGADVVQLFDTYAGVLPPADYESFLLPLHREILEGLDAPSIVFARGMGGRLGQLADSGADVVGLDWTVDVAEARAVLGETPVQGNLDPSALFADPGTIRERTFELIEAAGPAGHVLNLGHGVSKDAPIEGVAAFVEAAKSVDR
jgi:uroporphyrinogen decarboxylase